VARDDRPWTDRTGDRPRSRRALFTVGPSYSVPSSDSRTRRVLLATGILVRLGPVLIPVFTLGALTFFRDLVLGRVTFIELLEPYLVELVVFIGFAYGVYRLTLWAVREPLPTAIEALDEETDADAGERMTTKRVRTTSERPLRPDKLAS